MKAERLLCILLALCAVFSLLPGPVMAAGTDGDTMPPEARIMALSASKVEGMPSTVEVIVDARDDQSGVEYMSAIFSTYDSEIYTILREIDFHTYYYDQDTKQYADYPDGLWHGFIQIPEDCEPGEYVVENLRIQDAAGNLADYCREPKREGTIQMPQDVMNMSLAVTEGDLLVAKPENNFTKYGDTAKVTVDAEGSGLQYQWYVKNESQSAYSKVFVNSPTYKVTMDSVSRGRKVYCVVTDKDGIARTSKCVTLRMAPTVMEEPVDTTVNMGETAEVVFEVEGESLQYQWYIKNAGKSSFSKSSVTMYKYTCQMSEKANGRQVYCVATDCYGNKVKSKTVTLRAAESRKTAAILTQPKTTYTKSGEKVKVTLKAEGDGLTYQWYIKNAGKSDYSKSSVTSATYSATMNEKTKDRNVYCVIKDQYGNSVKSKTATLYMAATIVTEPKHVTVAMGEKAKVSVKAVGDGLTYQWYVKNAGKSSFSKSSVTKATYSCTMSEKVNGREVYCVVTDEHGKTATSKTVVLKAPQAVTILTEPKTTYTKSGEKTKVSVKAVGDGLTYQWYIKNNGKSKFKKSSVTKATYSATMDEDVKDRKVYCVVKDQYGNSVQSKTVTLRMAATVTTQPKAISAMQGATVKVSVEAAGDDLTYQWYYKNREMDTFEKTSVTKATYSCTMSEKVDGRKVYCVVTDKYGKSDQSTTVNLTMNNRLRLTQEAVVEKESYLNVDDYSKFLNAMDKQAVIPGLEQHYVPQGITVSSSTGLVYISAYYNELDSDTKKESVVMVLKDGELVAEYHLIAQDGEPMSGHVGGVAVTDSTLFVAWGDSDKGKIAAIPLSSLTTSGSQAVKMTKSYKVPVSTAFLSYHDGYLWVGNFYEPDDPKHRYELCPEMNFTTGGYGTYILGYDLSEKGNERLKPESGDSYAKPDCVMAAPVRVQGMVYDQDSNTVVLSRSYKRNANSSATAELNYYTVDMDADGDTMVPVDGRKVTCYILNADRRQKTVKSIPMNEGVALDSAGYLWVVHESGAGYYRNDGGDHPTDRIWKSKKPLK